MDTTGGMTFAEVLALPGVQERQIIRSRFALLAYHGGHVERVTSMIATMASRAANASLYTVEQPEENAVHIPSIRVTPDDSPALADLLASVDWICTVHGYGRRMEDQHVLIGGLNRPLAEHVARHLDEVLDSRYRIIADLAEIPPELRGVHKKNPANIASGGGIQLELPPALRWNSDVRVWADEPGTNPTKDILALVDGLSSAIRTWLDNPRAS